MTTVEDPVSAKLSRQLAQSFIQALGEEIKNKRVLPEIQNLVLELLEEVKLNYIQNLSDEDRSQILEQTRQLRDQATIQPEASNNRSAVLPLSEQR